MEDREENAVSTKHYHFYHTCGLVMRSELTLPDLVPASGQWDVSIDFGPVPTTLPQGQWLEPIATVTPHAILLAFPVGGRFLIRQGREILIDCPPCTDERLLRLQVTGACLAALLVQRGHLVLHANTVLLDDGCVAFVGHRGAGKSTLTAFFHRARYPLVGDDLCPVVVTDAQLPMVLPGIPRFKLRTDSLSALGEVTEAQRLIHPILQKYALPARTHCSYTALPLRAIVILEEGATCRLVPVRGAEALRALCTYTYSSSWPPNVDRWMAAMELQIPYFHWCTTIARTVPVWRVHYPRDFTVLPQVVTWLAQHLTVPV